MTVITRNAKYDFEIKNKKILSIVEETLDGRSGGKIFPTLASIKALILGENLAIYLNPILDEIMANCKNEDDRQKIQSIRNENV